jgi:hypothetical protein
MTTTNDTMGTPLDQIRGALDRLREAYESNDAEELESVSRELDELGQMQLVLAGLNRSKRKAIEDLYFMWWPSKSVAEDVAQALSLPTFIVEAARRESVAAFDARQEAEFARNRVWSHERERAARATRCPTCAAEPGVECRTAKGYSTGHHTTRYPEHQTRAQRRAEYMAEVAAKSAPALAVECPTCAAGPGASCLSAGGNVRTEPHAGRYRAREAFVDRAPAAE